MADEQNNNPDNLSEAELEAATAPGTTATDSTATSTGDSTAPAGDTTATKTDSNDQVSDGATGEQAAEAQAPAAPTPAPAPASTPATAPAPAPTPAPTPAPAPAAKPAPAPKAAVQQPAAATAPAAAAPTRPLSHEAQILLAQLEEYMEKMKPGKPMVPQDGARHQVVLYRTLTRMINNLGEDFDHVFGTVLKLFHEHSAGVFNDTHVFRFMEHVALPATDRTAFQRLVNLIKVTANPQARRQALKQTDFGKSLEFGVTDEGRNRVLAFFRL